MVVLIMLGIFKVFSFVLLKNGYWYSFFLGFERFTGFISLDFFNIVGRGGNLGFFFLVKGNIMMEFVKRDFL